MTFTRDTSKWTYAQQEMLWKMKEYSLERNKGKEVHMREIFPSLSTIHDLTVLGLFSWSSYTGKWRILLDAQAYNYGGAWCTPADMARDYLSLKYPNRRIRVTTNQWRGCCETIADTPLYCRPKADFEGVYIDVKSAYWQIVKAFGWDVDYCPSKYIGKNSSMEDFPFPENKLARNCMVSCGLPGSINIWTGSKLVVQKKKNKFVNLVLWQAVQDVLHGAASDAVRAGALYVFTDGYIVEREKASHVFDALSEWGLETSVKYQGRCTIRNCGDYDIQERKSKRKLTLRTEEYSNLRPTNTNWLRSRFARMADAAIEF